MAHTKLSRKIRQRGNAMLEGALALPPLLMLLFATIDFSVAILVKNTVQSAVREGVRYAVTGQTVRMNRSGRWLKTIPWAS
jgi:Flp pilus assembly protein TadG